MADHTPANALNSSVQPDAGSIGGIMCDKEKANEKKSATNKKGKFEFCKVCRINHDNGRRHNYFTSHTKSLSSLFSRFQKKLSDVRFSLKNPKLVRPQDLSPNRIWCVFCETDIDEHRSSFASENAIRHLESENHLKNLKQFLWKYGGGMNKVDSFRFSDAELAKWEKKCEVLKSEDASSVDKSDGSTKGVSTDIQPNNIMKNYEETNFHFLESSLSNHVMPLQYNTNENYQATVSDISQVATLGSSLCAGSSSVHGAITCNSNFQISAGLAAPSVQNSPFGGKSCFSHTYPQNGWVFGDKKVGNGSSSSPGLLNLTQLSSRGSTDLKGNVHTGAPPPWFHGTDVVHCDLQSKKVRVNDTATSSGKSGKSNKLNPKRVGAAWAEKRKIEIEMERRGDAFSNIGDADWLPNFGRVWQSGSRKESKKEFENAKKKFPDTETNSAPLIKIQPYISKRMRIDAGSAGGRDPDT